jgi:hypothetical protein
MRMEYGKINLEEISPKANSLLGSEKMGTPISGRG